MRIPKKDNFFTVVKADPAQRLYTSWRYYSWLQRAPFIARLGIAAKLLGRQHYDKLLDLGFGSGFFLPELSRHCRHLFGLDLHRNIPAVQGMLKAEGTKAHLACGNLLRLPLKDASFDCVVSLSVLEFVEDLQGAMRQITRVAKEGATIIIGAPVRNPVTDFCYDRLLSFSSHRAAHKSDHTQILKALEQYCKVEKVATYPFFLPKQAALFFVAKARKR